MKHEELTEKVIGVFYSVYRELGYGFLESVYEEAMDLSLVESGLSVTRQLLVPVWYHGKKIGEFKADLVVNNLVLVELKADKQLEQVHESQTLNYLRATDFEVALLFNFGPQAKFKRLVFDNERKAGKVYAASASQK
jgi:GxxExxY protein